MQQQVFDTNPQGGRWTYKLGRFDEWAVIILQVIGPATIFIAKNDQDLVTDTSFGRQGIQITQAQGIVQMFWKGDLWVSASVPTSFEFTSFESNPLRVFGSQGQLQLAS